MTPDRVLVCGDRRLALGERTYVMGVVNVTPDSFSDGGRYLDPHDAYAHAMALLDEGADVIDLGGESTRPGATPVTVDQELQRLVPVVDRLVTAGARCLSVDTSKPDVAEAVLDLGASWINDVTGFEDPGMAEATRRADAVVVMHQRPTSTGHVDDDVTYVDVTKEVRSFLDSRVRALTDIGFPADRIVVDPGLGFGKTVADNLVLLRRAGELADLGAVLVGPSRKRFVRAISGSESTEELDDATAGACVVAAAGGCHIVRVHAVGRVRRALTLFDAARRA